MSDDRVLVSHINLARGYRGGERQTQLLLEGLAARGWRQRLVARKGEPLALRCKSIPGLEVIEVRANLVSAVLVLGDVGLVHVHEGRSIKAAYLNSIFRGIGYMVTRRVQTGPRHSRLNHLMYRRSSAVVAISAAIYRSLVEMQSNLEVLQIPSATSKLSVDPNRIKAIRERFGNEILVGHIGALDDSHKGQLQIIALAKMLNDQAPQVSFVLVGSGRDEVLLKREAAGLENVHFVGQVEIDNVETASSVRWTISPPIIVGYLICVRIPNYGRKSVSPIRKRLRNTRRLR
jgi:glycosyltransferase involved in cell wall biosynthesis